MVELLAGDYTRPPGEVMVNPAVTAHDALSMATAERGEFDEAVRLGEANVRIASDLRHPFSLVHAVAYLAWIHMLRGTLATAAALCERGLTISREAEIMFLRPRLSALLGSVQAASGDADAGVVTLRAAVEAQRAMGFRSQWGPIISLLSEGLLAAGRLDEAEEQADRAMALAIEGAEPASQARLHRLLGEIATRREPPVPTVAKQHYQEALGLIVPRGMRPLVAHCHLGLADLYHRTEKREEAQQHLATATTMYRDMGMAYWLEKAEMREFS